MNPTGTHPLDEGKPVTVRSLEVVVTEGPDAGKRATAPEDRLTVGTTRSNHLVLTDPTVSRFHLELIAGDNGVRVQDLGSRNGTWLSGVALEKARVPIGTVLEIGRTKIELLDAAQKTIASHRAPVLHGLLGATPQMRRLMATLERAAPTAIAVLIAGESGTGKELVARALHDQSDRAAKPFVVVDCGALTPSLVASALFGHERGSFTGAEKRHIGAFERADGGTVFLDEVGELPLELQPQLLGVLERKRFLRIGSDRELTVDVRIVSATNRDLRREVNRGTFREDLYYRLSAVNIDVPPLRHRVADLPLLIEHFMREAGSNAPLEQLFPAAVLDQLARHHWPGNVRELRNFVEATVVMGEFPSMRRGDDVAPGSFEFGESVLQMTYGNARAAVLDAFERHYLAHLVGTTQGNVSSAARIASMDRSYLIKLLQKHGLK